jgi:GST-like protein
LIVIYGSTTPNVLKVTLALEEIGYSYSIRKVDVWRGEQFKDSFVHLNPNSKVPVLLEREQPSGEPHVVFESGAILLYLAEKSGRFLPQSGRARYEAMQWLMFQIAGLGPISGKFNHLMMFAASGNDYSRSRYLPELKRLYGVIERRLAATEFVGGEEYSIADMAVFPWIRNQSKRFGDEIEWLAATSSSHPCLARWFEALSARPAVQRAIDAFEAIGSTLKLASNDELDRVFGRGKYASD